jgi:hypothetical protein
VIGAAVPPGATDREVLGRRRCAVVTFGREQTLLDPGQSLSFGRGRANGLRIGHQPEDLGVPRAAGRLECRTDGVLVHNASDKVDLMVRPHPGPEYRVEPRGIAGTQPHAVVKVVVVGRLGAYELTVDAAVLLGGRSTPTASVDEHGTVGFDRIEGMRASDRRMLAALCLPLLTRVGPRAVVPTYAEVATILSSHGHPVSRATVRRRLDELRTWLGHEHCVDALVGDGAETGGRPTEYVQRLARWAIASGNVTPEDLDELDTQPEDAADRR